MRTETNIVIICEMHDLNSLQDPEMFKEMRYVVFSRANHHLIIMVYAWPRSISNQIK